MKNWKYIFFLMPTFFVLACATAGIQQDLPMIKSVTDNIAGSNHKVEAKSIVENPQETTGNKEKTDVSGQKLIQGKWKDGVYFGSGTGYGGVIKVSVTIKEGKILDITVISHDKETPDFYAKAEKIVQKMISAQSVEVDTISGATLSSNGIRQAVIQALNQAVAEEKDKIEESDKTVQTPESSSQKSVASKKERKKTASGLPADGTYVGSAVCENFDYTISIKVTFKNGKATKISDLKVTGNNDSANKAYWVKAYRPTVKKILKNQSSDVDVVSGATFSSNAIMEAYENAKAKAIEKNGKKAKLTKKKNSRSEETTDKTTVINVEEESLLSAPEKTADGTYHVEAVCEPDEMNEFEKYSMYADVTFVGGKLTSIDNISSNAESNQKYYQKAANGTSKERGVIAQLIEKQSASGISAVSGATCSSKTILALYAEAVKAATGQDVKPETVQNIIEQNTTENSEIPDMGNYESETWSAENGESETSDGKLLAVKDGTYLETVIVEPDEEEEFDTYFMTTEISFRLGTLENIRIISTTDDSNQVYYNRALNGTRLRLGILAQLQSDPLRVPDVVSGATCSFHALYEAFQNACVAAAE